MKKDKILSCIIGVCVALFCGTIGYLFGAQGFNINQKARALKSPVTITKEIKEKGFNTKKIAYPANVTAEVNTNVNSALLNQTASKAAVTKAVSDVKIYFLRILYPKKSILL